MRKYLSIILCLVLALFILDSASAKESTQGKIPKSVIPISKENTYPNPADQASELVPSDHAKKLLKTAEVPIENPTLIKLLNESTFHPSKWSIGYHATVYLGVWPLSYDCRELSVNWEYKKVNDSSVDARGSKTGQKLIYLQENQASVSGGLTAKVPSQQEAKKLIMAKTRQKTGLPISFHTIIGKGTKIDRPYQVQPKQIGHLIGYVPAVNVKGKLTYGEVYLVFHGGRVSLHVKNVTEQGIGAWLPVQDHLSLRYLGQ